MPDARQSGYSATKWGRLLLLMPQPSGDPISTTVNFAMPVRGSMLADPFSDTVYAFRAKWADRIKLIFWDGTG